MEGKFKIVKVHFQMHEKVGNTRCIMLKTVSMDTLNTKVHVPFINITNMLVHAYQISYFKNGTE